MSMSVNPNDADRYPFVVPVVDAFERERAIAFGAETGRVICNNPGWFAVAGDELTEEAFGHAWAQAVNLARQQRSGK